MSPEYTKGSDSEKSSYVSILNYNFNVARLDPTPLGWFIFTIYKHFTLNTRIIVFLNLIILYCYSLPWKVIKKLI